MKPDELGADCMKRPLGAAGAGTAGGGADGGGAMEGRLPEGAGGATRGADGGTERGVPPYGFICGALPRGGLA